MTWKTVETFDISSPIFCCFNDNYDKIFKLDESETWNHNSLAETLFYFYQVPWYIFPKKILLGWHAWLMSTEPWGSSASHSSIKTTWNATVADPTKPNPPQIWRDGDWPITRADRPGGGLWLALIHTLIDAWQNGTGDTFKLISVNGAFGFQIKVF